MSQVFARSFFVAGEPAVGYKLILGALGGVTPLDYSPVGQTGLLNAAIPIPASGVVAVVVQSDERFTASLYDVSGELVYREDVAPTFAATGVTAPEVAATDIIGIELSAYVVSVADGADVEVDVDNLFGDGSVAAATTGITSVSANEAVATEAYAAGVVTITGVAAGTTTVTVTRTLTNGEIVNKVIAVTVTA